MNQLLKPLVFALFAYASIQIPVAAQAPDARSKPDPSLQSSGKVVTTWMLTYRNSWGAAGSVLQSVEGIASLAACEAVWSDVKEVLTLSVLNVDTARVGAPHKCIRVEKIAR